MGRARFNRRGGIGVSLRCALRIAWWGIALAFLLPFRALAAGEGDGGAGDVLRPDPYASMHAVEMRAVVGIQKVEGLGRVMEWISHLGPGKPMLALIAVILCLVDLRLAARLAVVIVLCLWLRELLAMILQSPRPYWFGGEVRTFRVPPLTHPTYGLPSGHATAAAAFWFFLAGEVRRVWAWGVAAAIVVAVCVSRVYLGLHFVSDVVLGLSLGALWVAVFRAVEPWAIRAWDGMTRSQRVGVAMGLGMGLVGISAALRGLVVGNIPEGVWPPYGETARASLGFVWSGGALCGMALAWVVPVRWTGAGDPWRLRLARLALAAAPAAVYFWRPEAWRLNALLPDDAELLKWVVRFGAGTFMGWASFHLLPRAFAWTGCGFKDAGRGGTNSFPAGDAR